ncbi:MAG: MipA/OmpV family protein [Lautropia sp.]
MAAGALAASGLALAEDLQGRSATEGLAASRERQALERLEPGTDNRVTQAAIGIIADYGPIYSGASRYGFSQSLGAQITWRGYTISSASVARASATVGDTRNSGGTGLTGPLVRRNRFAFGYGASINKGRSVNDEDRALGLKPLPATIIGRLRMRYYFDDNVTLTATLVGDVLGKQNSVELPIGIGWTRALSTSLPGKMALVLDAGLNITNRSSMDNSYGIGPAEREASGLPLYRPKAGVRELAGSATIIYEPSPDWVFVSRLAIVKLVGPAAASPLVTQTWQPSMFFGFARRFNFD